MKKAILLFLSLTLLQGCGWILLTGVAAGQTVQLLKYGVESTSKSVSKGSSTGRNTVAKVFGDGTVVAVEPFSTEIMWEETRKGYGDFNFKKVTGIFTGNSGYLSSISPKGDVVEVAFKKVEGGTEITILWGAGGNKAMSKKMLDILDKRIRALEK